MSGYHFIDVNFENIDKNVVMLGWMSYFTDMATAMIQSILPLFIVLILHEGIKPRIYRSCCDICLLCDATALAI